MDLICPAPPFLILIPVIFPTFQQLQSAIPLAISTHHTLRFVFAFTFFCFFLALELSGQTGRVGAPGRREVGHGALAEKALSYSVPGVVSALALPLK